MRPAHAFLFSTLLLATCAYAADDMGSANAGRSHSDRQGAGSGLGAGTLSSTGGARTIERSSVGAGALSGEGGAAGASSGTARGGIGVGVARPDSTPSTSGPMRGSGRTSGAAGSATTGAMGSGTQGTDGAGTESGLETAGPGAGTGDAHLPAETTTGPSSRGPR